MESGKYLLINHWLKEIPVSLGRPIDDLEGLLSTAYYRPDLVLQLSPGRIGVILFLTMPVPESDLILQSAYLLYDKRLLKKQQVEMVPLIMLEVHQDVKEELINLGFNAIQTAEKLTDSTGDMNHLVLNFSSDQISISRQQFHSGLEHIFLEDSLRWDRTKEKYLP